LKVTTDWNEFYQLLDKKFILLAPFCGGIICEEQIKEESAREDQGEIGQSLMGAKTLCIPLEQPDQKCPSQCIRRLCTDEAKIFALFGRSY
jgi:hypothetical protein